MCKLNTRRTGANFPKGQQQQKECRMGKRSLIIPPSLALFPTPEDSAISSTQSQANSLIFRLPAVENKIHRNAAFAPLPFRKELRRKPILSTSALQILQNACGGQKFEELK
ncbi:hypothetical protein CEXT_121631 [Caerostris extrusa]|uniref:Uncharacterized protein n=1 Tax=Caerostris extrusa TaxID=172846 RepID=A0AAV4RI88_CAEEX|nr:hypothetical protein CEXT_121631 [Caerostris extrusa]